MNNTITSVSSKILRIGFITNTDGFGGSEVYLGKLFDFLQNQPFKIYIFCLQNFPAEKVFPKNKNFNLIFIDDQSTWNKIKGNRIKFFLETIIPKKYISVLRKIRKQIIPKSYRTYFGLQKEIQFLKYLFRHYNLDILHSNEVSPAPEPAIIAAKKAGIKTVVATFNQLPMETKQINWAYRYLFRTSFQSLDQAIFVSRASQSAWLSVAGRNFKNHRLIYYGLDLVDPTTSTQFDRTAFKRGLGLSDNDIVVGCSARLHPTKGHSVLIEAAGEIVKQIPNVKFVLVGEGFFRDEILRQISAKGLAKHFHLLGFRGDMMQVTSIYDVAVLPSIGFETFGLVLLEAMACRKPVVVSDFSGMPEVIEENVTGFKFPKGNAAALREVLLKLLKDIKLAQQMGEAGYQRYKTHFTCQRMCNETLNLYHQLASQTAKVT